MAHRHRLAWTDDEIARLRHMWGLVHLGHIARTLRRTECAVRGKAKEIGLPFGIPDGHVSIHAAAQRAGYHHASFRRALAWWRARGEDVDVPPCLGVRSHRGAGIWRTIAPEEAEIVAAAYAQSELPGQAAARLGLTPWTLARRAKAAGHKSAPMLRLMPEEWDALVSQPKKRGPTE